VGGIAETVSVGCLAGNQGLGPEPEDERNGDQRDAQAVVEESGLVHGSLLFDTATGWTASGSWQVVSAVEAAEAVGDGYGKRCISHSDASA
jgi:hypothetical protein